MRAAWRRLRGGGSDRGVAENIDAVVLIPVMFLILVVFGLVFAQIGKMSSSTDNAAAAAARAATQAATSAQAQQAAQDAAAAALGSKCSNLTVDVDLSEWNSGAPGVAVTATVRCTFPLTAMLGVGDKTVSRTETSPLDPFREGQ